MAQTILIIDDSASLRQVVAMALQSAIRDSSIVRLVADSSPLTAAPEATHFATPTSWSSLIREECKDA